MHWTDNWHMGLMWVALALLLIGSLLAITRVVAKASSQRDANRQDSPRRILQRRYAAGEIDEETYEHMLEQLSRRSPGDGDESDE